MPPAPYPNPGSNISMNWESDYNVYQSSDGEGADDTMSRGYDLGGRNLQVDGCSVANAGSHGNDGEGIMGQRHNHMEIYSWAITHSRQYVENSGPDTIGENGWIGGYDIDSSGFRVERRINGGAWKVIAYRPRISLSKSSDPTDPWSPATLVSHINNPVWEDYTAPRGLPLEYRVFAIDANDDANYGSNLTPSVTVGSTIPTTPTNLTWLVVGSNLQLSWPSAYIGWELQSQTNSTGIDANGGIVPNSSSTNQIVVPINPLSRSVFYRLYYSP